MLTKKQLHALHTQHVPLHILELDYIQSIVLKHIYRHTDNLVFKGGTNLRKTHGLNRFSEDLDFNILTDDPEKNLTHAVQGLKRTDIPSTIHTLKERKNTFLASIRYQGPLYTGADISRDSLQIEISKHPVHLTPEWETIISLYPDTGTFSILSMHPQEILAEKIRSLVQRKKPRDLYDIWFLLKAGVTPSQKLVTQKFVDLDLPSEDPLTIIKQYHISEKEWQRDMNNLMERIPEKKKIKQTIIKQLRKQNE